MAQEIAQPNIPLQNHATEGAIVFFLEQGSCSVEGCQTPDPPPILRRSRWRPPTLDGYKNILRRHGNPRAAPFPLSLSLISVGTTGTLVPVKFVVVDLGPPLARGGYWDVRPDQRIIWEEGIEPGSIQSRESSSSLSQYTDGIHGHAPDLVDLWTR
jgi:hypothetical protein